MNHFPLFECAAATIIAVLFYIAGYRAACEQDTLSLKLFLLMFVLLWSAVFLRHHLLYDTLIVPSTAGLVTGIGSGLFAINKRADLDDGK